MSPRIASLPLAVICAFAAPAVALADTTGGASAPLAVAATAPPAQAAAGSPGSTPAPSSPGQERTGIVNVTSKGTTTHRTSSKPSSKPVATPRPVVTAPAPVAAPRLTGADGLPYTGGAPILVVLCGLGFVLLGVGLRLRYGLSFRSRPVRAA
ncbi:MAG: hypothetical protein JWN32_2729 [Solirubrobacterales bacterium]|jgi:hypothetical protein|nr:hypothetical protein [Solirubrobacterales bacterium]